MSGTSLTVSKSGSGSVSLNAVSGSGAIVFSGIGAYTASTTGAVTNSITFSGTTSATFTPGGSIAPLTVHGTGTVLSLVAILTASSLTLSNNAQLSITSFDINVSGVCTSSAIANPTVVTT